MNDFKIRAVLFNWKQPLNIISVYKFDSYQLFQERNFFEDKLI